MTDMIFKLPEETVKALQEIANIEQVELDELLNRVVKRFVEQHKPSITEEPVNLDWLWEAQFTSNERFTGRNADDILREEWNPDPRD